MPVYFDEYDALSFSLQFCPTLQEICHVVSYRGHKWCCRTALTMARCCFLVLLQLRPETDGMVKRISRLSCLVALCVCVMTGTGSSTNPRFHVF